MFYEAELDVLRSVLKKCRVNATLIDLSKPARPEAEESIADRDVKFIYGYASKLRSNTVYKTTDSYSRSFIFFILPEIQPETVLVVGPYSQTEMNRKRVAELAKKFSSADGDTREMENYFTSIPFISKESHIYALLDTFYERVWGGDEYFTTVDLNYELRGGTPLIQSRRESDPEKTAINMQVMEQRYAFENDLMHAVSQGHLHKTELLLSAFSSMHFEERTADPVRNAKNYCIIMNTLLRKSAENGGVHPVYLDSVSSAFAHKIEAMSGTAEAEELMGEMFRSYCRLVRKHSMKHYSPPIQKVIATIDFDLTANLGLSALAAMQNISPSYLSALFKQEVGQTLTEYVNNKRIKRAMQLLEGTKMQVQAVAQQCGILDVHYFSKIFKKITGMTPKEYRESLNK